MFQIKDNLDKIDTKLMNCQPEDLQNDIKAVTKKTEQNRAMARNAQDVVEFVLNTATDTEVVSLNKTTDEETVMLYLQYCYFSYQRHLQITACLWRKQLW